MSEWRNSTWGDEIALEYGKALRDYSDQVGAVRVFGTNGPIGWTDIPLAPGPGIILGRKGAYRGVHYSPEPFFVIDTAYYVVPKSELDMRWLYYAIIHYRLGQIDDGSPIPSTTRAAVYPRKLAVPRPEEQRAIAGVLGALDDKIEQNRRTARALERLARAIFRAWFVDFDPVKAKAAGATSFPSMPQEVFDALPTRFVDSEIGPVPEGWEVGRVSDLGKVICGKTPLTRNAENYGGDIPFITIPDMHGKTFVTKTRKSLSHTGANTQQTKFLPEQSICVSCIATPGLVVITFRPAQTNQQINSVIPGTNTSPYYCYEVLSRLGNQIRAAGSGGSVFHNLSKSSFSALPLLLSSRVAVRGFHRTICSAFESILAFEIESKKLVEMRDYLLPKLLSGQVRVEAAQGDNEPAVEQAEAQEETR